MKNLKLFCVLVFIFSASVFNSCKKEEEITNYSDEVNQGEELEYSEFHELRSFDYTYNMGINLNEQVHVADTNDLRDSKTKWVRCFIDVIAVYKAGSLHTDPRVLAFIDLKARGYKTALSLKFDFKTHSLPTPNSFPALNGTDWTNWINFLWPFLDKVMPYTDILIVGNEPFIEAAPQYWNVPLNNFYKAACLRTHNYFINNIITKPIFLGSFDNLYLPHLQTNSGYIKLFAFAKSSNYLAGVDLHIHHVNPADMISALNFANARIRPNQKMLVTEFSLKKHWMLNNNVAISSAFIAAANASTTDNIFPPPGGVTKNFQYINHAINTPRPKEEWDAFWANSQYLYGRRHYLCKSNTIFTNRPNVFLTFYALRQAAPSSFTVNSPPWLLNGLFMNSTVEPHPQTGRNQKSYSYLDQFHKIVDGISPCN